MKLDELNHTRNNYHYDIFFSSNYRSQTDNKWICIKSNHN